MRAEKKKRKKKSRKNIEIWYNEITNPKPYKERYYAANKGNRNCNRITELFLEYNYMRSNEKIQVQDAD
jgi:hypothetical protein